MKMKEFLSIAVVSLFAVMLIHGYAAKAPTSQKTGANQQGVDITTAGGGVEGATPTPCPPGWATGASFPAAAVVRGVGVFFPTNGRFYVMGGRSSDTAGGDL